MNYVEETKCRICGHDIVPVFDLGVLYESSFIALKDKEERAPLVLAECSNCELIQLQHTVALDSMYRKYWYRSGLNRSMKDDLKDVIMGAESAYGELSDGDVVIDIGCNDGTMFDFYSNPNITKIGYDPANNLAEETTKHYNIFINDYFSPEDYNHEKAKIITSIAMFYDLPDPKKFVSDIKSVLDDNGIWVIQFTDLLSMLKINAVDNICFEHLEYYKLMDIVWLLNRFDLKLFDVEYNMVNGGSLRVYACHSNSSKYRMSDELLQAMQTEIDYFDANPNYMKDFEDRIDEINEKVNSFLAMFKSDGKKIYGLAASTKGNTLLQVLHLDSRNIIAIGDINKDKFNLFTSGTHIQIIPEQQVFENKPDVLVILAWHFTETFNKVTEKFVKDGGYVLYPLPKPYVLAKEGNFYL